MSEKRFIEDILAAYQIWRNLENSGSLEIVLKPAGRSPGIPEQHFRITSDASASLRQFLDLFAPFPYEIFKEAHKPAFLVIRWDDLARLPERDRHALIEEANRIAAGSVAAVNLAAQLLIGSVASTEPSHPAAAGTQSDLMRSLTK